MNKGHYVVASGVVIGRVVGWKRASKLLGGNASQEFRDVNGARQLCWVLSRR